MPCSDCRALRIIVVSKNPCHVEGRSANRQKTASGDPETVWYNGVWLWGQELSRPKNTPKFYETKRPFDRFF